MTATSPQGGAAPKTKVAVLGSGMGAIAAMYSLTQRKEDRDKYEITCYLRGWRVGGKGASGRNMNMGARIEEHGLHIWFGFYDNAFTVMRDAYKELNRPPSMPLATIEKAFTPHDYVVLMDTYNNEWRTPWQYTFPPNGELPGGSSDLPSFWSMMGLAVSGIEMMLEMQLLNAFHPCSGASDDAHTHRKETWWDRLRGAAADIDVALLEMTAVPARLMLGLVRVVVRTVDNTKDALADEILHDIELGLIEVLKKIRAWLWSTYGCHVDNDRAREALVLGDSAMTVMIGMLTDQCRVNGIFSIDDVELSAWLTSHGASPVTLGSPIVRALYDNIFAYENGDVVTPNAAAGTSLLWLLRMIFSYRGHLMYKMNAGMGDTIFAPFYMVLKQRGVTFKFFNCVTNLGLDADKSAIDTIQVMQQVDLAGEEYDPFVIVKELPCWPNEPNWDQIVDGAKFKAQGVALNHIVTPYVGREPMTLKRGEDFDLVVLGIPVAALPGITPELYQNAAKPAWKSMCDGVGTVQTQAYQIWANKTLDQLGWIHGADSPVLGTYVELIDTYADMSQLIPVEDQPAAENVQSIAYFCGAMPNTATQGEADALANRTALQNLERDMPRLWTNLDDAHGQLNWSYLVDPKNQQGADRWTSQFVRANWIPTERYTLCLAGTTKVRLKADQSGYANLYLAGDWTDNHFNSGCIEASTMSGMQASRAICGYPATIVGESPDLWEGDR